MDLSDIDKVDQLCYADTFGNYLEPATILEPAAMVTIEEVEVQIISLLSEVWLDAREVYVRRLLEEDGKK